MAEFERFGQRKGNKQYDFEDVDDFTFLNSSKQSGRGFFSQSDNGYNSLGDSGGRQEQIEDEIRRIEERTLLSSERSLGLIYDSEKVGIATAEELVHQREQLQNSEAKVDEVNRTLRTTQKHINSIKSIFGGIKGYFSKSSDQPRPGQSILSPTPKSESTLKSVIENSKNELGKQKYEHPGLRTRDLDDLEDDWDDVGDDKQILQGISSKSKSSARGKQSRFEDVQNRFDKNLEDMSSGLGRLKGLACELQTEIEDQNELVDRLTDKIDKTSIGVERQTKQMRQIK